MELTHSDERFGAVVSGNQTTFRLYFPDAATLKCIIFEEFTDSDGETFVMKDRGDGIWEATVSRNLSGKWYLYSANYKPGKKPDTLYASEPFSDPYSRHITANNHYRQDPKSYIFDAEFEWSDNTYSTPVDTRDLIIYETHIKDLVHHPSSGSTVSGIYNRWNDLQQRGGIPYLKKLGVNAVEFLPIQKFPYFEPPFKTRTKEGILNTWNPCSRNHWGYMTSFFFAPETTYASDSNTTKETVTGPTSVAIKELKTAINRLHNNEIAVILDVVFNHTSLFDINPLSQHLPDVYLRKNENGERMNRSWTGNEFRSEFPPARKLMLDALAYWMQEYHVDGFRFDLAGLIDEESWDLIRDRVRAVNPNAILIAEPWGGRYVPWLFTNHGWSSWNDRFRNGIKGSSPITDKGFIFSEWHQGANRLQLENWLRGTLKEMEGGLFNESSHTVNYLESHDGYTLGDFIRIASRNHGEVPVISDKDEFTRLDVTEMKIAKLAAFCLFVSQGMVMISSGQEFARSKIIRSCGNEANHGKPDHNSYNKDNETNWINFDEIESNRALFDYYRGLIRIRRESPALRKSSPSHIHFSAFTNPLQVCMTIDAVGSEDFSDYIALMNASDSDMEYILPKGTWEVIVNEKFASHLALDLITGKTVVPSRTAMLLRKLRH